VGERVRERSKSAAKTRRVHNFRTERNNGIEVSCVCEKLEIMISVRCIFRKTARDSLIVHVDLCALTQRAGLAH
jgi:hypothetical protein